VERTAHKSLPLILAREFASNLATPLAIFDENGTFVFFNEPAERIIGQTPAELGNLLEQEWRARFSAERLDGTPVADEDQPTAVARRERRPAHETLVYKMLDGRQRTLSVTAIPLLGREDELVGVVSVFWEQPNE
jgi:PAS domain S-box-containing protein